MVMILTYLRDHRVIGTQTTGNLPLKAIREVTSCFVHPPVLDSTIGEHTYRLKGVESTQTILRGAVYRMVVYVLGYLGMAEIEYRKDKHATIVSSFKMTAFGRGLLEVME
jgi:hypothetical protein